MKNVKFPPKLILKKSAGNKTFSSDFPGNPKKKNNDLLPNITNLQKSPIIFQLIACHITKNNPFIFSLNTQKNFHYTKCGKEISLRQFSSLFFPHLFPKKRKEKNLNKFCINIL
jgi:hypothetical protein